MGWAATLGALRRRWYVVVVGVLVSAALGFAVLSLVPPAYQVSGTVLLMPSTQQTEEQGNPFLGLDSLSATGLILAARLNSDQEMARLTEVAPTAEYLVGPDPILGEPALLVTAQDITAEGAFAVLSAVLDEIPVALAELQEEVAVPAEAVIESLPLTRQLEPEVVTEATERALVAAVGGGLALTVGAAVGIDALARRRRRRADGAAAAQEAVPAPADEPPAPDEPAAPDEPSASPEPPASAPLPVAAAVPAEPTAPAVGSALTVPVQPTAPGAPQGEEAAPHDESGSDGGSGADPASPGSARGAALLGDVPAAPRRSPWPPVEAPRRHARRDKAPVLTSVRSVLPSSWSLGSLTWPGSR